MRAEPGLASRDLSWTVCTVLIAALAAAPGVRASQRSNSLLGVAAAPTADERPPAWSGTVAQPSAASSRSLAELLELFVVSKRSPGPAENGDPSDKGLSGYRVERFLSKSAGDAVGTIGPRGEILARDGSVSPYRVVARPRVVVDRQGQTVAEYGTYGMWVRERDGSKVRGFIDTARGLIFRY